MVLPSQRYFARQSEIFVSKEEICVSQTYQWIRNRLEGRAELDHAIDDREQYLMCWRYRFHVRRLLCQVDSVESVR